MTDSLAVRLQNQKDHAISGRVAFAIAAMALAVGSAVLAGWTPILFSIITVFLFAGPHNWLEFRYFLSRMPARWGKLRGYFLAGFGGSAAIAASYLVLFVSAEMALLDAQVWYFLYQSWTSALLIRIALMADLRSQQPPRRNWIYVWPVIITLVALVWIVNLNVGLALVYIHPMMAFWLLDRELRRSRPQWRPVFHMLIACVPLFVLALWWHLADAPPLPVNDELSNRISDHAGASILTGISSHFLVATHTFLEMLHYGVWIVAIPTIGLRVAPWRIDTLPLVRNSPQWHRRIGIFMIASLVFVILLWTCFLIDYNTTRNIYFALAVFHVVAEVPFLLRAL